MIASASNVVADIGRLFGEAIARKIDQDLASNFANFSTVVGGNTVTATAAKLFEAIAKLRSQGYDTTGDCAIVLHPEVAYDLKSSITSTFAAPASMVGNSALESGYIGLLGGVPVYETSNITSTSGDSIGGLFHRDALGLALMQDIKIETQRQAALRGWDIVGSAIYGHGELQDAGGVALSFDSSIV
jgi:hypothetical protein